MTTPLVTSPSAQGSTPAKLPVLEVFVDLPNFERALKRVSLPAKIDLVKLGEDVAGTTRYLKQVHAFAASSERDTATGRLRPEGYHQNLAVMPKVNLQLGHRLDHTDARGAHADQSASDIGREKGVDVGLAITMMERACDNTFDIALLIANDSDYCVLMQQVAARGKTVLWGHLEYQATHDRMKNACSYPYRLQPKVIRACVIGGGRPARS